MLTADEQFLISVPQQRKTQASGFNIEIRLTPPELNRNFPQTRDAEENLRAWLVDKLNHPFRHGPLIDLTQKKKLRV